MVHRWETVVQVVTAYTNGTGEELAPQMFCCCTGDLVTSYVCFPWMVFGHCFFVPRAALLHLRGQDTPLVEQLKPLLGEGGG